MQCSFVMTDLSHGTSVNTEHLYVLEVICFQKTSLFLEVIMVTVLIKQKLNKSYNMIMEGHEETKGYLIMQIS
jgi:hypothetical protein